MGDEYQVHSYHLNIDSGDSAIHLLAKTGADGRQSVQSIVLVDGGFMRYGAVWINHFCEWLHTSLVKDFQYTSPHVQFDAIVISHWDSDHCGGIVDLLEAEVMDAPQDEAGWDAYMRAYQPSILKFDATGAPLTHLYMPYFTPGTSHAGTLFNEPNIKGQPHGWELDAMGNLVLEYINPYSRKIDVMIGKKRKKVDPPAVTTSPIAQVHHTSTDVLGFDFFRNQRIVPNAADVRDLTDPRVVSKKLHDTRPGDGPAMFCLISDCYTVGEDMKAWDWVVPTDPENITLKKAKDASSDIENHKVDSTRRGPDQDRNGGLGLFKGVTSAINQSSIACMIIWPDADNAVVTHYFAGDLGDETEDLALRWSTVPDPHDPETRNPTRIKAAKMSHHGAKGSTPLNLLYTFDPRVMVVSNGMMQSWNHPKLEIVIFMLAWNLHTQYRRSKGIADATFKFMCTNFPLYLSIYYDQSKDISTYLCNPGTVEDFIKEKELQASLQNLWQHSGINAPFDLDNIGTMASSDELKSKTVEYLADNWAKISNVPVETYLGTLAAGKGYFTVASNQMVRSLYVSQTKTVTEHHILTDDDTGFPDPDDVPPPIGGPVEVRKKAALVDPRRSIRIAALNPTLASPAMATVGAKVDPDGSKSDLFSPIKGTVASETVHLPPELYNKFLVMPSTSSYDPPTAPGIVIQQMILAAPDGISSFLSFLKLPLLVLTSTPIPGVDPTKPVTCAVDEVDGLADWFQAVFGAERQFVVYATPSNITGFALSFTLRSTVHTWPTGVAVDDGMISTLAFSTEFAVAALGDMTVLDPSFKPGDLCPGNMLIMGLDPGSSKQIKLTLWDICYFLECDSSLLALLDPEMQFTIDVLTPCARNAVWFLPDDSYTTTLRLQFQQVADGNQDWLKAIFDRFIDQSKMSVQSPIKVIAKKTLRWVSEANDSGGNTFFSLSSDYELSFLLQVTFHTADSPSFSTVISFTSTGTQWLINFPEDSDVLKLIDTFSSILPFPVPSLAEFMPQAQSIKLRRLVFILPHGKATSTIRFDFEFDIADNAFRATVVLGSNPSFSAGIFPDPSACQYLTPIRNFQLLPGYEDCFRFTPTSTLGAKCDGTLSLSRLAEDVTGQPISTSPWGLVVLSADLTITENSMLFCGMIGSTDPPRLQVGSDSGPQTPQIQLDPAMIIFQYDFPTKTTSISASLGFDLYTRTDTTRAHPMQMECRVAYNGGSWTLDATLTHLKFSYLYQLFDDDSNDQVMSFLENIDMISLGITYHYVNGTGNDFTIVGKMGLGSLELDFEYCYSAPGQWTLSAILNPLLASQGSSLADVVVSICGPEVRDHIPACFLNISSPRQDPSSSGEPLAWLELQTHDQCLLFVSEIKIVDDISVILLQLQYKPAAEGTVPQVKRVFFCDMAGLPQVKIDIPMMVSIAQPFDKVQFAWVQGGGGEHDGLTRAEIDLINTALADIGQALTYKETRATIKNQTPADILMSSGSHFMVECDGKIVLDYAFDHKAQKEALLPEDTGPSPSEGSAVAAVQRQIGPLSISGLGLGFENEILVIKLVASMDIGVFDASLIDLEILLDLAHLSLANLSSVEASVRLHGLSLGVDAGELQIAGLLLHESNGGTSTYTGGAVATFVPYSLMGIGQYSTTASPSLTSLFAWLQLNGPLLSIEVISIVGVKLGFGYNTAIRNPDLSNISAFPFCASIESEMTTPMALLDHFLTDTTSGLPWITSSPGTTWFGAGMEVIVCETVDVSTAIMMSISPQVCLDIYANASLQMPTGVDTDNAYLNVQLGVHASVNFSLGAMVIQSALAQSSFVLTPSCHLSGGFAMCLWWSPSPVAGDWVFTVGGYHAQYKPKPHYPVPARLTISWTVDDDLSISGQAYFAMTPEVVMAGGLLVANFSASIVWLRFEAWVDVLINLKPFWFEATIGVSIDGGITIGWGFLSISFDFHFGADVYIAGPAVHGYAQVSILSHDVRVYFGKDSSVDKTAIDLGGLVTLLLEQSKAAEDGTIHVSSLTAGSYSQSATMKSEPDAAWVVRGGSFQFHVSSIFPSTTVAIQMHDGTGKTSIDSPHPILSKPMQVDASGPLSSTMTVTIESSSPANQFRIKETYTPLSSKLWGEYTIAEDPLRQGNNINSLLNPPTTLLSGMTGVTVSAPLPVSSSDTLSTYNAVQASQRSVNTSEQTPVLPSQPTQSIGLPLPTDPTQPPDPAAWDTALDIWTSTNTSVTRAAVIATVGMLCGWSSSFADDIPAASLPIFEWQFNDIYPAPPRLTVAY